MGYFRMPILFLLSLAIGCGDERTLDNKEIRPTSSKLVTLNNLTYPLSSMTSWTNSNYGACGNPDYFNGKCHNGADIFAAQGTPVYAIAAGTVVVKSATQDVGSNCVSSGWGFDYGQNNTCNMGLLVRHLDGSGQPFVAVYGHLRYNQNVSVGATFTAGEQIGVIGRWYNTNGTWKTSEEGDHLHWGIFSGANPPTSGFGMTRCSASQPASSTFPQGCSNNGFVPPGTFITQHFLASPPFSHGDPPSVCATQPTHDASWYYTCVEQAAFEEGERVWVLLRLHDVNINHQFRVKAYKDDVHQWDWTTSLNNVGSNTWQYSHFWPELQYALSGKWRFDLFLIPQGGSELFVNTARFRVFPQGTLYEEGGGGTSFSFPGQNYYYDGNGYTCPGPIEGGEGTNWVYTCGIPRTTFEQGETVSSLVRLDNITSNFRFSVDTYKNSMYQWNYTSGWNNVGQWGWSKSYYPTVLQNAQPGNWEFRVSVDEGNGFELLDTLSFVVTPDATPFEYSGFVACRGPVTGGAETSWEYTCQNPTDSFSTGQSAIALVRIDNVFADHRWKEEVYINGTYQWNYTTNWNDVGQWGWSKAYFQPTTSSVWPGAWEYRIYLDTGNSFQYLDSAYFTVSN